MKNKKETYRLIGTINILKNIPDFVYVIFEKNGKYYFENSEDSLEITSFEEVVGENHINMIEKFGDKKMLNNPNKEYHIGDEPVIGYQPTDKELFIGTIEDFFKYAEKENIQEEFVQREINYVKNEREKNKELKLMKKINQGILK